VKLNALVFHRLRIAEDKVTRRGWLAGHGRADGRFITKNCGDKSIDGPGRLTQIAYGKGTSTSWTRLTKIP